MTQPPTAAQSFRASVDFGRTAADYRQFRAGFPDELFRRLAVQLELRPGQRAVDLGTGTGTMARGLAKLGLEVIGVDPAEAMLREAAAITREEGLMVAYRQGRAEAVDVPDGSQILVTAGQCWHWFDRPQAAKEALRMLEPGGHIVIAHFDWLALQGNVVEATETLIREANPAWTMHGGTGIHPRWLADLANAGFAGLETASFDVAQPYSHEAWIGRIRASAGVKATLDPASVEALSRRLADMLRERFPGDPLFVPHRVWWVFGASPLGPPIA